MERKMKLAKLIQIESENLKNANLAGQLALAEEITRDAMELANIVLQEEIVEKPEGYDQVLDVLASGFSVFPSGSEADRALESAAKAALENPATSFRDEISLRCDLHIKNILRFVN